MAAWPSGKAEDCKSFIPSSNLGAAFDPNKLERVFLIVLRIPTLRRILKRFAQNVSHLRSVAVLLLKDFHGDRSPFPS